MGLLYAPSDKILDEPQWRSSQYGIENFFGGHHHMSQDPGSSSVVSDEISDGKGQVFGGHAPITITMGESPNTAFNYHLYTSGGTIPHLHGTRSRTQPRLSPTTKAAAQFASLGQPGNQMAATFGVVPTAPLPNRDHSQC